MTQTQSNPDTTLYATVVKLMASQAGPVPATQGRLAQAAFLDIIRRVDPALAEVLHEKNQRRPYTVSPLHGLGRTTAAQREQHRVNPGDSVWLRFTLLGSELFTTFSRFLLMKNEELRMKNGWNLPSLRLGEVDFAITEMLTTPGSHPWAGYTRLAELAQGDATSQARRITLEFASPTVFSRNSDKEGMGKFLEVLPRPEMVFGSLAARWNELMPTELDKQAIRDYAAETVVVGPYKMESKMFHFWGKPHIGAMGRATYLLKDTRDTAMIATLNRLAEFAFYSGVGAKTAMGMGQVRRVVG